MSPCAECFQARCRCDELEAAVRFVALDEASSYLAAADSDLDNAADFLGDADESDLVERVTRLLGDVRSLLADVQIAASAVAPREPAEAD